MHSVGIGDRIGKFWHQNSFLGNYDVHFLSSESFFFSNDLQHLSAAPETSSCILDHAGSGMA